MDPKYARRYRDLHEKHWWWRAREEAVVALLRRFRPPQGYGRILDAGCGDGLFFPRLSEFGEVDGLEPDANAVNPSGPFAARIHSGPFDDSFQPGRLYGLILMLDVLEHLPDPAPAVRRIHSLLVPGGIFVATVPAFQALWTTHDVVNHHFKRYTRAELRRLLSDAGFRVATSRYWYHWTFPVKLAQRFAEMILRTAPEPPAVPPALVNRALLALCRLEQKTITRLNPPFGSSVMSVGVKPAQTEAMPNVPAPKPMRLA